MEQKECKCVSREECEAYRNELIEVNNRQDITLAKVDTELSYIKKIMFSILSVLISGFAGTIFAILSLN